jgi:Ca2+-binding RTX toxin-like protein
MTITIDGMNGKTILLTQPGATSSPFSSLTIEDTVPGELLNAEVIAWAPGPEFQLTSLPSFNAHQIPQAGHPSYYRTVGPFSPDFLTRNLDESTYKAANSPIGSNLYGLHLGVGNTENTVEATYDINIAQGHLDRTGVIIEGRQSSDTIVNGSTTNPFSNIRVIDKNVGTGVQYTATLSASYSNAREPGSAGTNERVLGTLTANSPSELTTQLHNFSYTAPVTPEGPFSEFDLAVRDNVIGSPGDGAVFFEANVAPTPPGPPGGGTQTVTQPPVAGPIPTPPTVAPPTPDNFTLNDTITGAITPQAGTAYSGPVTYLTSEFISPTQDSVNINSHVPNAFIVTGAGNDAIDVRAGGGQNVISAGAGNNFLTGGSGDDTFFVDDRTAGQAVWDTINNFHAGDQLTIWGLTPQQTLLMEDNQGAVGYTGLTLYAQQPGSDQFAAATLSGYAKSDLTNGRLTETFGSSGGDNYMLLQGH